MNEPKWRTFAGFKRVREEVTSGQAWDVRSDGDVATVRVPTGKKLVDVTFSFRQNDEFLEKIAVLRNTLQPGRKTLEEVMLLILGGDIVTESLPRSKYRSFRQSPKKNPDIENQTVVQPVGPQYFSKLGISQEDGERAMVIAAEAIAKHFLERK